MSTFFLYSKCFVDKGKTSQPVDDAEAQGFFPPPTNAPPPFAPPSSMPTIYCHIWLYTSSSNKASVNRHISHWKCSSTKWPRKGRDMNWCTCKVDWSVQCLNRRTLNSFFQNSTTNSSCWWSTQSPNTGPQHSQAVQRIIGLACTGKRRAWRSALYAHACWPCECRFNNVLLFTNYK